MDEVSGTTGVFRKEGEYWTIACDGRVIRIRHTKGLGYLSHLFRQPGERFPVTDLLGGSPRKAETPAGNETASPRDRERIAVTKAIRTALRKIAEHDPALGERLYGAVRTGKLCCYVPGSDCPSRWED